MENVETTRHLAPASRVRWPAAWCEGPAPARGSRRRLPRYIAELLEHIMSGTCVCCLRGCKSRTLATTQVSAALNTCEDASR
jgi:hypothetical protein